MKQYPVKFVEIPNGEKIAYRQAGEAGAALVLIHGNISSSVFWQTVMEQLESDYRIFAPDMRGFGDSSYNAEFSTIGELAEDIKQFINAVGIEDFYVVGWSAGGPVAAEIAADWPDRVKHMVLLCTGALNGFPYARDENSPALSAENPLTKEEINNHPQLSMLRKALENGERETLRFICNLSLYKSKQPPEEEYEQYLEAMTKQRCKTDIDYALITYNMTHQPNMAAREGSGRVDLLKGPVTILHSEEDVVTPLVWGQATKELLGDRAELVVMKGLGHSPVTDDLPLVVQNLKNALK